MVAIVRRASERGRYFSLALALSNVDIMILEALHGQYIRPNRTILTSTISQIISSNTLTSSICLYCIIMGVSHSTARWLAPASFLIDFAAQQYGLLSSPNMMDVHNAHLSFWSPQPYFIGAFFFPQQLLQLAWLYRLYKLDGTKSAAEKKEADTILQYVPYYAVGNLCIASMLRFQQIISGRR